MSIVSFSQDFITSFLAPKPVDCGIPPAGRAGISPRYLVTITAINPQVATSQGAGSSTRPYITVVGYLQEKVEVSVSSNWEGLSDVLGSIGADIAKVADTALQAGTGLFGQSRSLASTVSSRRKWTGSSPITLNLVLKFEALNDIWAEVLQPCMSLQKLVLPGRGNLEGFFLIPPGPSPFKLNDKEAWGDLIKVDIGGFLVLDSVIIKAVDVTYENRMSDLGPIGAQVKVTVESYELLTKQSIDGVYPLQAGK